MNIENEPAAKEAETLTGDALTIAFLKANLEDLRTGGIVTVAMTNPNVMSYMEHWEGRAEKAEKRVEELETALRAHNSDSAEPVAVKPLEWTAGTVHHPDDMQMAAIEFDYRYFVGRVLRDPSTWECWIGIRHGGDRWWRSGEHYTCMTEAKAAAQADYETRIRSALASPPAKEVEITDEMVERAAKAIVLNHSSAWEHLTDKGRDLWRKDAKDALTAALTNRTPDDEVGNAGHLHTLQKGD